MRFLKIAGLVIAVIILLIIGVIVGIGFFLSPQSKLRQADMIIAISGGETSQRTKEAVKLYKEGYAPKLLFSGAAADQSGPSNAAAMRADAVQQGVPENDIIVEENAKTTAENAARTAPIIRQYSAHTIILVTSPYHQRRAALDFRQILGPDVIILNHSATDSVWRKSNWWQSPSTVALTESELKKTLYVWSTKPENR